MTARLQRNLGTVLLVLFLTGLPAQLSAQAIQTESFRGRDVVAGEIIVGFRGERIADEAVGLPGVDTVTTKALTPSRAMLIRSRSHNVSELLQEYSARPDVLYAEPNYLWHKEDVPNDLFFNAQWGLRNTGQSFPGPTGTAGADIKAVQAWDIAQGSRSIVIGIVDSGIDYNHPDLAANIWSAPQSFTVVVGGQSITCAAGTHGFNAITRTCDPLDDDPDRHGTLVAGIIGAAGDNSLGVSGVSRVSSMMALKFIGDNGSGSTADAIAAIEFAVQVKAVLGVSANVRVLNNSWGSTTFSQALLDAVNAAANSDVLFVAGAGNEALNTDQTPHYPSSFNAPNVVSVAATDNRDELSEFSNYGPTSVDLGAPGRDIASTRSAITYAYATGTSMSTAMVSGAAGLVLSGCSLTTAQLKANLIGSVDELPDLWGKMVSGGRLNVYRALVNCAGSSPPVFTLKSESLFVGGSGTATIRMNPLNGFSANVSLVASAPAGITVSLASSVLNAGSPTTTMTVTAGPNVAPGTYPIYVTGTSGSVARTAGLPFIIGSPIALGQNLGGTLSVASSQPDLFRPAAIPPGLANWHQVVLNSTTSLDISLLCFSGCQAAAMRLLDTSGAVLSTGNFSSGNILQISRTLIPGTYFIVVSALGNLDANYWLAANAPLLASLNPFSGEQNSSIQVQLSGAQFAPGLTVVAGNDITVSNVVFNHAQSASATFAISATAALGPRAVSVRTPAGPSNNTTFTVLRPRPVITSISPPSGVVGTSVDITILGANFDNPTVELISIGPKVTLDNVVVVSTTTITGRVDIPINANIQGVSIRVTTLGGFTSGAFSILPLPPMLTSITPSSGSLGSVVDVTLSGANFYGITITAGAGITVTNVSILSVTTATARFTIEPTAVLGTRSITVTTSGGTSGVLAFTVIPAPPPTLTSFSPADGAQGTTRLLDVRGTNFTTGFSFNAGPDIVVSTFTIVNSTRVSVTLQIGGGAALGPRAVTVSTAGGMSNSLTFTVLPPPPTLTSISPASGVQESSVSVMLVGTNFVPGLSIQAAPLSVSQLSIIDSTSATAVVTIPVSTQTGNYSVRVVTASGSSAPVTFTVLPGTPSLSEIHPTLGVRGRTNTVTLIGTNFATGSTTISAIPGVSMAIFALTGGSLDANFTIASSAPLGPHNVSVTTPGGTTGAVTYTIVDPFPDLFVSAGTVGPLWAGINNTYPIFVGNKGTAAATSMVLTDMLPPSLTFVSGGGNGFSCSANGQLVTCMYTAGTFTPLSETYTNVTVAVAASAPSSVTHTVSAPLAEDLIPSNNTATGTITILQPPVPQFTFAPLPVVAGQQATVGLSIATAVPQDITGTLAMTFSSATSIPSDDPAMQFWNGGRQKSFLIRANTLQADFFSSFTAGPIAFQPGTVAGTITFNGTLQLGTAQRAISSTVTIAPAPPVVHKIRTDLSQGVFAALVTSSSTPRSVNELSLQFNTMPTVQLSCGSVSGCTVSGNTLTFDVKALFDSWFTASSQFGSLSTLRVPLTINGNVHGSVNVTLKNALGTSNSTSFSLP